MGRAEMYYDYAVGLARCNRGQKERIFIELYHRKDKGLPLDMMLDLRIANYRAVISELRRKFIIECEKCWVRSWFGRPSMHTVYFLRGDK